MKAPDSDGIELGSHRFAPVATRTSGWEALVQLPGKALILDVDQTGITTAAANQRLAAALAFEFDLFGQGMLRDEMVHAIGQTGTDVQTRSDAPVPFSDLFERSSRHEGADRGDRGRLRCDRCACEWSRSAEAAVLKRQCLRANL